VPGVDWPHWCVVWRNVANSARR